MTLQFPQLSTGAAVQFPLTKTFNCRTTVNRLLDGSTIRVADPDASSYAWELQYRGLTDAERVSLEEFFLQVEGRLRTFLFLDPCANLLTWSDEPARAAWSADPLLRVEVLDSHIKLTNTSQTTQELRQTVAIPGWNYYCFSAQVMSPQPSPVQLVLTNADGQLESAVAASAEWESALCSGRIDGAAEEITCVIRVAPGAVIWARRLQLQAQPNASGYRTSTSRNGIFRQTRFDDDALTFRADGLDDFATTVRLISRTGD